MTVFILLTFIMVLLVIIRIHLYGMELIIDSD